jgi:hypothetical protein
MFNGHAVHWGQKNFHNVRYMGIKRRRILCRFQKYKLTFVKNAPKKQFKNIDFLMYVHRGPPLYLHIILRLFIPHIVRRKKIPLYTA